MLCLHLKFLARKPSVLPVPGVKLSEPDTILQTEGTGRAPELNHRLRKTMFIDETHGFLKRHFPETNPTTDAHFVTAVWISASMYWLDVHHMSSSLPYWTRFSHVGDATTSSAHSKKVRRSFLSGWDAFGQADLHFWLMGRSLFNLGPGIIPWHGKN